MQREILVQLITQRLNPTKWELNGLEFKWLDPAWDTPENRAIVADVKANYETLKLPVIKADKMAKIRAEARGIIEAKYPVWYQANVATGIYSEATGDTMKTGISLVITESNRCEDLADAATTEAQVDAITPNWPVI